MMEVKIIQKKLLQLKSNEKFLKVINNEKNMGKSYSVIRGLRISKYSHVILIDSDLPYLNVFSNVSQTWRSMILFS